MMSKSSVVILVGLILTLGIGSLPFATWDNEFADVAHLLAHEAIYWTLVLATIAYVAFVERRPLASIGFRMPSARDAWACIAFAVLIIGGFAVLYIVVLPALALTETKTIDALASAPTWWLAISVVRAGVSEEILFRGYPIERLQELTGSRWIAAVLPLTLFALAHVGPWGWSHVVVAAFGGAMLTVLYLWRRNLWINIAVHVIVDAAGMLATV